MKSKFLNWIILAVIGSGLVLACAKEALWNQDTSILESQKGTILGQLIHDDDGQPLKGIKILFERQTTAKGKQTFVDTVSTDTEGKFSYQIPFPNKVKLSIRDTGRYAKDEMFVEVLENKEYDVTMHSHPRFGVSDISVVILDANQNPLTNIADRERVSVALSVRDNSVDAYSSVDTLELDENGKVLFEDVAFPVYYKVAFVASPLGYTLDSIESKLITKEPIELTLNTEHLFSTADIQLSAQYFFTEELASNVPFTLYMKTAFDTDFVPLDVSFDAEGKLLLHDVNYPAMVKIIPNDNTNQSFREIDFTITTDNALTPFDLILYDVAPRFEELTPSANASENTLVTFYDGLDIRSMEVDDKGNIFAVTRSNTLVRIPYDGGSHKVLASGFDDSWGIALKDSHTIFVVENKSSGGNKIKKVVIDPIIDVATVTVLAGTGTKKSADGTFEEATFDRPADAVYDAKRNVLWVTDWEGRKVRKLDFETEQVTTIDKVDGRLYSITLSRDNNFLYIGSFNVNQGIHKYDIEGDTDTRISSAGDIRHVVLTPDNKVFYSINKEANPNIYHISSTGGTPTTAAGNNTKGLPAGNYVGTANTAIATEGGKDFVLEGMVYDAYSGRLYFSAPLDKRLYYIKLTSAL